MDNHKSWKKGFGKFFKTAKSMFKKQMQNPPSDSDPDSDSAASPNPHDDVSTSLNSPLSSARREQNFEGIALIWYDPQLYTTEDTRHTAEELRQLNDYVMLYYDQVECVEYMKTVDNEKIFFITSGKAAMHVLPEIKQLTQVDTIFIFCYKDERYQHLMQEYESIIGIYTEPSTLIESIKQNVELLQRQLNAFNFYDKQEEKATRDVSKESAEFLWFQLFKDVILRMPSSSQAKQELIDFCRQYYRENRKENDYIDEFEQSYLLDKSIYWYTRDTFLYRLVNKALRTEDLGQLHLFRFFMADLSSSLVAIHNKQNSGHNKTIMLYRGLKLENDELKRLKQNIGCLISTNGFLSTSYSKVIAMEFASRSTKRVNVVSVLYEIECDLKESKSLVFAEITQYSEFAQEQEVLFDLGSTFKIESVRDDGQLKIVFVKLKATDDGIKMAQKYIELNRKMNEETSSVILFGILLVQMGRYDQSLTYFRNLLNESNTNVDLARVYNEIGSAFLYKGQLDEAFENADHAYRMMISAKPSRIKDSSRPLTIMAHVYLRKEMYEKSLDLYFEALEIREKFYGRKHLDTAVALNNIGNACFKQQNYVTSSNYYTNALDIRRELLPDVHLDIAASFNNLGLVHWKMEMFDTALYYHLESLNTRKKLLPSEHNDIVHSLNNIAHVFYEKNEIDQSLEYFTEALRIQKIDLDSNDRDKILNCLEEKIGPRLNHTDPQFVAGSTEIPPEISNQDSTYPEYVFSYGIIPEMPILFYDDKDVRQCVGQCELIRAKAKEILDLIYSTQSTNVPPDDCNYQGLVENVEEILRTRHETTCFSPDNTHDLMNCLSDVIRETYHNTDESDEAIHFYEKILLILDNSASDWLDANEIQMLCLDRIIHIHQQNDN